jgi:hypothetical protein
MNWLAGGSGIGDSLTVQQQRIRHLQAENWQLCLENNILKRLQSFHG